MSSCCIDSCKNNYYNNNSVSYYGFPMYRNNHDVHEKSVLLKQRLAWMAAVKDISSMEITNINKKKVCSAHFISGRKAHYMDVNNVDWIPSINLNDGSIVGECEMKVEEDGLIDDAGDCVDTIPNPIPPDESEIEFDIRPLHQETADVNNIVTDMNLKFDELKSDFEKEVASLQSIINVQNKIIQDLQQQLLLFKMDIHSFSGNDKKTAYYTGLPSFDILKIVYEKLEPLIDVKSHTALSKSEVLIMTLMKLRLGLPFVYLGYRFGVSTNTACRQFYSCLEVMYRKLQSLVFVPERAEVIRTMPEHLKKNFGKKVTHIVDCCEFLTEKPHFMDSAAEMWSEYKHHYTVKMLISITPQCFIEFISKLYGGRATDIFITTNCGFLEILVPDDFVLADKGFQMNDQFEMYNSHLELPAFVYNKQQLHPLEIERTRKIANVRIHVERVIGFVKRKFLLLHQIIPMTMLSRPVSETDDASLLDKIMTVCCALCNLCPPIYQ